MTDCMNEVRDRDVEREKETEMNIDKNIKKISQHISKHRHHSHHAVTFDPHIFLITSTFVPAVRD